MKRADRSRVEMYFTTDTGQNIYQRIEKKKTFVFENHIDAKEKAKQTKTYPYPVYVDGRSNGFWAVPK